MDYSRFLLKPFDKDLVKDLQKYPEFQINIPQKEKLFAFMVIMWEPANTDFRRLYPNYYERKREAALLAGLTTDKNGHFPSEIEGIIMGTNDDFNTAVVRYLMLFGLPDYPALIAQLELQAKELVAAFSPSEAKDRKIIRENIDKSTERIAEYEEKIFGGAETENVRKALYHNIEADRIRWRPEYVASDIAQKKLKVAHDQFTE